MSRTPYFFLLAWLLAQGVGPAFAFKMESGALNIAATSAASPTFTRRTFQQTYSTPPVVIVMTWPTGGDDSSIVRVRNVTTTSFEATVVESPGEDGPHAAMSVHYFAIEPGIHTLTVADAVRGTRTITIEAGHLHTTQNLRCTAAPAACVGGFATHSFASAFATTPVVMVDLQTFNVGASGVPPAPPVPFVTASIDNVTGSGFAYTIDRHEVTAGSLTPAEADSEVVGYVALDSDLTNADFNANNAAALLVEMETIRIAATAANAADGWDDRCNEDIRFSKPMPRRQAFATKQTRRETDGGWLRLCSRLSAALLRVNVVEDRFGDAERNKTLRDGVGVLLFSDAFFFDSDFRPPTAGFKLEADRFTLTPGTPVTVTLRQYYEQPPAVFVILDNSNPEPTAVRVLDVSSDASAGTTRFTALAIEPQGAGARGRASTPGGSAGTAHYLAVEKGLHVLPGGKLLEVNEVLISDVQQNFPGTRSFRTVNFSTRFAAEPAVLTQLIADANVPGDAQVPWLTLAVRTSAALRTTGFQVALERSQVNAGGAITVPERVAYMAVETGALPVFTDNAGVAVSGEFQNADLNGSANAGWDNICFDNGVLGVPFLGTYAAPPLVIASEHSHRNNDGGWQRWCRVTNTHARIVEDEDQFADVERSHPAENSSLAVFSQPFDVDFALVALYAMEEPVWNSGTLGQVANTTTLFADGTPVDNAATAIASPARTSGSRSTCRYGSFDGRADLSALPDGVAIGSDNLALSRALTVSAWIRWQIDPVTGNNAAAYIQNDRVGSYSDFQFALRGSANNRRFEFHAATSGGRRSVRSGNIVNANIWYHVTGVYDGSTLRLYVDDSLVDSTPLSGAFVAFDATRELNLAFSAHPGNNHHAFNGVLDEVRIYRRALTTDEIRELRLFTRPCSPDPLDHYALNHAGATGGFAVTCEAAAVTLRAHDSAHAAVAPNAGTRVTITANPGTRWALGSGTPANFSTAGADASYVFDGVENAVGLFLTQTTPAVVSFSVSDSGSRSVHPSESPTLEFRDAIFDFQPVIATQIAGKPSDVAPNAQALTLRAIETNSATGACQAALDGTHAVEFAFECRSPATCALAVPGAVNTTPVPGNPAGSPFAMTSAVNLTFVGGAAPYNVRYDDAGSIALHARTNSPATGSLIQGASAPFVARPFALRVNVAGNPRATTASGAVFKRAGEDFALALDAVAWSAADDAAPADGVADGHEALERDVTTGVELSDNALTPNFTSAVATDVALLGSYLVRPLDPAANDPGLSDASATPLRVGPFAGGLATTSALAFDEVGIIEIEAAQTGDYLGIGASETAKIRGRSGAVGRFIPAWFDVGASDFDFENGHQACGFTYIGQIFRYAGQPLVTLTARTARGATARNYVRATDAADNFFKFSGTLPRDYADATSPAPQATFALATAAGAASIVRETDFDGSFDFELNGETFRYDKDTAPDLPFEPVLALTIAGGDLTDDDGVCYSGTSSVCNIAGFDRRTDFVKNDVTTPGVEQRFGRMTLTNAVGSELVPLPLPLKLEYFTGTAPNGVFAEHTDDACTSLELDTDISLRGASGAQPGTASVGLIGSGGATQITSGTPIGFLGGRATLVFAPPTPAGHSGFVDVTALLGSAAQTWLQFDWDGDGAHDDDPTARASFGLFGGRRELIYIREPWD